ncbi:MAG: permease-like cell division protein FtsX [Patescibacteria group bacterium]|nr:permease-like cell division protein FtsX [Patescibacteria group bacterium]
MITLYRIIKFGLVNFWRNWVLSSASIIVLAISILIISAFVSFNFVLQKAVEGINQKVDLIAYFNDSADEAKISQLQDVLSSWPEVKQALYVSKNEALKKWLANAEDERLKTIINEKDNPLPRSLEVKLNSADQAQKVIDFFEQKENKSLISKVRYNRIVVEKIVSYSRAVTKVGIILSGIFVLVAIYVVLNTLRLAIYSRKEEIDIMKLVGASPGYIVFPFVVEGILFGFLGAIIAFILSLLTLQFGISALLPPEVMTELSSFLQLSRINLGILFLFQLFLGIIIGVICSLIGINRYLRKL